MAKIAQISAKYIVHASITIDGLVDRPDVIGAIFGQTEGLLGSDLELRELQRSGRIGRIEVNITPKGGKASGEIIVPSSLDKAETAIVAAALEIIQRIGPCNAKIRCEKIEDIRISKRQYVIERAKELLRTMMDSMMPDSGELADEVATSVRVMEIVEWGPDRLPAGPTVDESEEVILVEGRADVLNLLKQGFKNVVSMNGTSIPDSVKNLCHEKIITVFVDGDRGGDLIIKELMETTEIDFVTKAPDGKEVEELQKKEIHKALRAKIATEQYRMDSRGGTHLINERRQHVDDNDFSEAPAALLVDKQHRHHTHDERPREEQRVPDRREERAPVERRDTERRAPAAREERPRHDREERTPRGRDTERRAPREERAPMERRSHDEDEAPRAPKAVSNEITAEQKAQLGRLLEDLLGTHGAYVLDGNLKILGKVPGTELTSTIKALRGGMLAVVYDGQVDRTLVQTCETAGIPYIVGMSASAKGERAHVLTAEELL